MNTRYKWFLGITTLLLCFGLILSFILPWWTGDISADMKATINIYGWGIPDQKSYIKPYMSADITPHYQVILACVFVGVCALIAFCSTWIRGKTGSLMLTSVGVFVLTYASIAYFAVITPRLSDYGIAACGISKIGEWYTSYTVDANIGLGLILAFVTGGLLFILGLVRVVMNNKPNTNKDEIDVP